MKSKFPVVFMAFDILELNGEDLRDQPYATRKAVLRQFIRGLETLRGAKHIRYTEHSESPRLLFEDIIQLGGEGIILKQLDSSYTEDYRSHNWLKVKLEQKAVCEVAGWTEGNNKRSESFGSLVLMQDGKYVGNVGGGFSDHELVEIGAHLKSCPSTPKPFQIDEPYTAVKTELKVLIRYHKRTENNVFRFPSFLKIVPSFFWGDFMEKEVCPKCKVELKVVYFLGVEPDFFVCPKCRLAYSLNLKENKKPLAHVIML